MYVRSGTIRQLSKIATPCALFVPTTRAGSSLATKVYSNNSSSRLLFSSVQNGFMVVSSNRSCSSRIMMMNSRSLSSSNHNNHSEKTSSSSSSSKKEQEDMTNEIVLTPGQKVVAGTRLTMWAGVAVFAAACAYYIGKELLPTKMSPNSIFDKATHILRDHPEIQKRYGNPLKVYGRDHGGHREGRRNFIEHTQYKSQDDGSDRTRVRFNLEGPFGNAFVFAEVSADMPSGEFVYLMVQDKRNGRVNTIIDNRSRIMAQKMAGGNKEGQAIFANLLGGGKKD